MSQRNAIGVGVVLSIVLLAGCSGVIPGDNTGPASGDGTDAGTPTPGQAQATPTATPEPTATPTPTPTPTPTATPVPSHLDYEQYGEGIAKLLNDYRGEEQWVWGYANQSREAVTLVIVKPEGWTVQDTEMEGAREVARASDLLGRNTVEEAKEDGVWVRPELFYVAVSSQNRTIISRVTIDADTAAAYANKETTLEEYATQIADSRKVYGNPPSGVTISEREPTLALRTAEYRPFKKIHLHRIATSHPFGNSGEEVVPEIEKAVSVPEEETIYYEHTVDPDANRPAQKGQVTRTYLETIKQVQETRRVNRLPEQMVLYQDDSATKHPSPVVTAKTDWALAYFALSDWTLPQNKTVTPREFDAYINRIAVNIKYIEDDENYNALNETVRSDD